MVRETRNPGAGGLKDEPRKYAEGAAMSDRDLSDRYARIRTALAMGPTLGPWFHGAANGGQQQGGRTDG